MKRPAGLILAAVALGLLSALALLSAAGMTFVAFISKNMPATSQAYPGNPHTPSATFVMAILLGFALFMAAVGVWGGFTVFGLFKLRNWARYSILVVGGLLTVFGGISALGSLAVGVMGSSFLPPNPQVPAHTMQVMMTCIGLFYLCFAALGTWWLVYFNLRSVKNYFLPAYAAGYLGNPAYPAAPPPAPGPFANVPTSIVVIGCLYLLAAFGCALCIFFSAPVLFLGIIFRGLGTHLLYLSLAVISGFIGWGYLRLDNRARLASYSLIALTLVNGAILATPWGQSRWKMSIAELYQNLYDRGFALSPQPMAYPISLIIFSVVFSLICYGIIIWLTERHRAAFLASK